MHQIKENNTMLKYIIVSDKPKSINENDHYITMTPHEFINSGKQFITKKNKIRVINLSNSYEYLTKGYYVSLLAEARGGISLPDLSNIISTNWKRNYSLAFPELNTILEKTFNIDYEEPLTRRYISFFGRHNDPKVEPLARKIFDLFRLPIASFEIKYVDRSKWHITKLEAESFNKLIDQQLEVFNQDLSRFTGSAWRNPTKKKQEKYWIGILHNPEEINAPSNSSALKKFIEIGKKMDVWIELITRDDFSTLLEFDALLIRETTNINNHTFRFAQKAEIEGIPVIDDTNSIIRCCNKVYLNEILEVSNIKRPKTIVLDEKNIQTYIKDIDYPCVLKIPDGAFSIGVYKINNVEELKDKTKELFEKSDVILLQEFMPSKFDWRIGILNNKPIFANKYYMATGHWQIYNHNAKKVSQRSGNDESVELNKVPKNVLQSAIDVSKLIGDGLYGVDLKEQENGEVFVIEINDNPNIDHAIEDRIYGDDIYRNIINHLISKIEE